MINWKKPMAFAAVALAGCILCACADTTEQPPFTHETLYTVNEEEDMKKDANDVSFSLASTQKRESLLDGKVLYWLGSSVTYGANSEGESMADFMEALTGCKSVKEAVSGTTIFNDGLSENTGKKSYTARLENSTVFDKTEGVDAFI